MDTPQKPLYVAFASQKGGVGKTTFTSLIASVLHYRLGYNVLVMDCDYPQYSLVQMRERDMRTIMENEVFKKMAHRQFKALNKKAYPVIREKPDSVLEAVTTILNSTPEKVDIVFFDLPGTVNTPGIMKVLASINYIFSPITADRVVMESTLAFTQIITGILMKQPQVSIKNVHLFWTQVDGRERSPLYAYYGNFIRSLKLSLMAPAITASVRFRKESEAETRSVFRSTLLPAEEKLLHGCNLDAFVTEFLSILKL